MVAAKLSPYLARLDALRKLHLLPNQNNNQFSPKIVFLDTKQGVSEVGDAIAQGWPVVTDYGATYGTAFPLEIREAIAIARAETEPLATVSIVTFRDVAYSWMDIDRIHPHIVEALNDHKFDVLIGISFIRFACNSVCQASLSHHYINKEQEVQVFIVPDYDPLMAYLRQDHNIAYIAVRSSNVTGKQEEAFVSGATEYAKDIGAPILAIRSLNSFRTQINDEPFVREHQFDKLQRKRFGSQPIISLSSVGSPAIITLVRAGNTSPSTLQKLMADIVSDKIGFSYVPEKTNQYIRPMYQVDDQFINPDQIRQRLLEHSGLK